MRNTIPGLGSRIRHLMEINGIRNAPELAEQIVSGGFTRENVKIKHKDQVENCKRAINLHLNKESGKDLSGEWIDRYCRFFHCSADYLLGYIEAPTHENASVSEITGLSDKSIEVLRFCKSDIEKQQGRTFSQDYSGNTLRGLNYILEQAQPDLRRSEDFRIVRTIIADIYEYICSSNIEISGYSFSIAEENRQLKELVSKGLLTEQQYKGLKQAERVEKIDWLTFEKKEYQGTLSGSDSVTVDAIKLYREYALRRITTALENMREAAGNGKL